MSSKIKQLAEKYEKYIISTEHQLTPVPSVKASITIPSDNNTYIRKVSTLFVVGETVEKAENAAISQAVSMLLGNKQTQELVNNFEMFDITSTNVSSSSGSIVKSIITVFKDAKPYRIVASYGSAEKQEIAEKAAIKSAVNKVMGV